MTTLSKRLLKSQEDVRRYWQEGRAISQRITKAPEEQPLNKWFDEILPLESKDKVYKMYQLATTIPTEQELNQLLLFGHDGCGQLLIWKHFIVLMTLKSRPERLR